MPKTETIQNLPITGAALVPFSTPAEMDCYVPLLQRPRCHKYVGSHRLSICKLAT